MKRKSTLVYYPKHFILVAIWFSGFFSLKSFSFNFLVKIKPRFNFQLLLFNLNTQKLRQKCVRRVGKKKGENFWGKKQSDHSYTYLLVAFYSQNISDSTNNLLAKCPKYKRHFLIYVLPKFFLQNFCFFWTFSLNASNHTDSSVMVYNVVIVLVLDVFQTMLHFPVTIIGNYDQKNLC